MKVSEQWLREWADAPVDTDTLLDQLTSAGLTVDSAEPLAASMDKVVVAEVLEVSAHPQADRLRVCSVDVGGGETLTVVCGAPNVRAGITVLFAQVGDVLPGKFKIKQSKTRGVASFGMICSATVLDLAADADAMLNDLCAKPLVEKSRYKIDFDGFVWEVDEFFGENQGLIVAEIELESEDQKVEIPGWIGGEVTGDPK